MLSPAVAQKVVALRKKQQLAIGPCKSLPNSPSHSAVSAASIPAVHINQVRQPPRVPPQPCLTSCLSACLSPPHPVSCLVDGVEALARIHAACATGLASSAPRGDCLPASAPPRSPPSYPAAEAAEHLLWGALSGLF